MSALLHLPVERSLASVQLAETQMIGSLISMTKPKGVIHFGFSYGRDAHNLLQTMDDDSILYTYDDPERTGCLHASDHKRRIRLLTGPMDAFSSDKVEHPLAFVFLDGIVERSHFQRIFHRLLPVLTNDALVAVHDTGVWPRSHFTDVHNHAQMHRPRDWLNRETFQHRRSAREFVNWVTDNYPEFQAVHLHTRNDLRNGITLLQRSGRLQTSPLDALNPDNPPERSPLVEGNAAKRHKRAAVRLNKLGIGDAACINLDHRPERWKAFLSQAEPRGMSWVRRFSAIDGTDLAIPAHLSSHRGTYGCLHSHGKLMEEFLEHGYEHGLILEDDCVFVADFDEIRRYVSGMLGRFSWIHLGGEGCCARGVIRHKNHSEVEHALNTHAYVADRKLMEAYVKWLRETPYPESNLLHSDRLISHLCNTFRLKICMPPSMLTRQDKSLPRDVPWGVPKKTKR